MKKTRINFIAEKVFFFFLLFSLFFSCKKDNLDTAPYLESDVDFEIRDENSENMTTESQSNFPYLPISQDSVKVSFCVKTPKSNFNFDDNTDKYYSFDWSIETKGIFLNKKYVEAKFKSGVYTIKLEIKKNSNTLRTVTKKITVGSGLTSRWEKFCSVPLLESNMFGGGSLYFNSDLGLQFDGTHIKFGKYFSLDNGVNWNYEPESFLLNGNIYRHIWNGDRYAPKYILLRYDNGSETEIQSDIKVLTIYQNEAICSITINGIDGVYKTSDFLSFTLLIRANAINVNFNGADGYTTYNKSVLLIDHSNSSVRTYYATFDNGVTVNTITTSYFFKGAIGTTLYASDFDGSSLSPINIYKSVDKGLTWTKIYNKPCSPEVIDDYLSLDGGFTLSMDGGSSFINVQDELKNIMMPRIVGDYIYVVKDVQNSAYSIYRRKIK